MALKPGRFGERAAERRAEKHIDTDFAGRGAAQSDPVTGTARFSIVPQVTGLTLEQSPGAVTATWDASPIADLKRYEIQIAIDSVFTNAITRNTRIAVFTWEEGSAGTTYYFRVRAVNDGGTEGDYSSTSSSAPGAVTSADIADGSITTAKLATDAVTNVKVANDAINTAEIVDGAVTTAKIASNAVTLRTVSHTAADTTTSGTTELQLATAAITSVGNAIELIANFWLRISGGTTDGTFTIRIRRGVGGTVIWDVTIDTAGRGTGADQRWPAPSGPLSDTPGVGSVTYELTVQRNTGDRDLVASERSLRAVELKR